MTDRRQPHAHRPEDLASLPRITADAVRATLMLIALFAIVVALCAVDPTTAAAR